MILGTASGLKLANILFTHTSHPTYKIGLPIAVFVIHMFFLLYIHFAYHELAEEVSHALFDKETQNDPVKLNGPVTQIVKNLKKRLIDSIFTTQTATNSTN